MSTSTLLCPEHIRASLGALNPEASLSEIGRNYQAFYGLDPTAGVLAHSALGQMNVLGYQVVTQLWCPSQPIATLIVLHGYYDHMGLYRHAITWGLSRGFCVLACDLPGHGLSSGERASIQDFAEYQGVLRALLQEAQRLKLPAPWHLMGQSTGAAILIDYLLYQPLEPSIGRSILMAPLVRPAAWWRGRMAYWMLKPFVRSLKRRFTCNSTDAAFIEFVQQHDTLQPQVLPTDWVGALARWIPHIEKAPVNTEHQPIIVQGELDATVDWPYNLRFLQKKFRQPQILRLPDASHHLLNEQQAIRQQYFDFLHTQGL